MRKIEIMLFIVLTTSTFTSFPKYALAIPNRTKNFSIYEPKKYIKEEPCNDILISLLFPYVQKSINDYYSKILTDIPIVAPSGINILSVGTVVFDKFDHIENYELPPNYQNIIKGK